jgi:orotidine 5'-phosphate decarboxylase subfamily 1
LLAAIATEKRTYAAPLLKRYLEDFAAPARLLFEKIEMYRNLPHLRKQIEELVFSGDFEAGLVLLETVDVDPRFESNSNYPMETLNWICGAMRSFSSMIRQVLLNCNLDSEELTQRSKAGGHTMGGLEMMKAAVNAAKEEASKLGLARPLALGVTILTSIDQMALNQQLRISGDIKDQVVHLATLAEQAGLDGVIASPQEIEVIKRNISSSMIIVTPGIRPAWAAAQDQKRIMTPGEAISKGATYIVIGRPITKPPSSIGTPVDAVKEIMQEIVTALDYSGELRNAH